MKRFVMRHLISMLCASGMLAISTEVMAAAFQLWEQDGASVGNYHAGYAALATNASTAYYNPAGLTRISNQQAVLGGAIVTSAFQYKGDVTVQNLLVNSPPLSQTYQNITAQGGAFSVIPNLHYAAPITDFLGFGFSIDAPFGLKTDYGRTTPLQYAATLSSITVIDISPSLGLQVTDKISLGAGFDVQKVQAQFDSTAVLLSIPGSNTSSENDVDGVGYGYHLGALYQFTPDARIGLSYHSQVVHHLTGTSKFVGPIANVLNEDKALQSNNLSTNLTLPAFTALSGFYKFSPKIAVMASMIYTQWSVFKALTFNNIAGAIAVPDVLVAPSTTITVSVPQYYRNTWNFSVGGDYYATDKIILRGAVGYDQSPVKNAYRNVQLPDGNRHVIAMGGHYQAFPTLGFDLGWTHFFVRGQNVVPPAQVLGGEAVLTLGRVKGGADVFGAQITWDIDKTAQV